MELETGPEHVIARFRVLDLDPPSPFADASRWLLGAFALVALAVAVVATALLLHQPRAGFWAFLILVIVALVHRATRGPGPIRMVHLQAREAEVVVHRDRIRLDGRPVRDLRLVGDGLEAEGRWLRFERTPDPAAFAVLRSAVKEAGALWKARAGGAVPVELRQLRERGSPAVSRD